MSFISINLFLTSSRTHSSKDRGKIILYKRPTRLLEDIHEALCLSNTSEKFFQPCLLFLIIFTFLVFLRHILHLLLCHVKTFFIRCSLQCFSNLCWKSVNVC